VSLSSTILVTERIPRRRIPAIWPFTPPLFDVWLYLLAIPLFWVLGLEQVLPVLFIGWAFIKLVLTRYRIWIPLPARIGFAFLVWQWVSATSIDISTNWFVFIKNHFSYASGLLVFLVVINSIRTFSDFKKTLLVLLVLSIVISLIGVAFVLGFVPAKFQSPIKGLLPAFLKHSRFIEMEIAQRRIGRVSSRIWGFTHPRVSSIFLYPAPLAQAYLLLIPLQFFFLRSVHGWKKAGLVLLLVTALVNFLLTAVRTSVIALVVASGIIYLLRKFVMRQHPALVIALIGFSIICTVLLFLLFLPDAQELISDVFVEARPRSYNVRIAIYRITLQSWLEHPLKGWGTQRALPGLPLGFPAGTHGEYLGFLYRYGIIGLLLHLSIYASIWSRLLPQLLSIREEPEASRRFLEACAVGLLAMNLNGVAHGLDWDITVPILLWLVIALLYTVSRIRFPEAVCGKSSP